MKKVLIANRGEIACRIIRSCKELGLETVAVYSDADEGSMHATAADEACHIGPPNARESYLVADKILEAARNTGADAIHPGYGFLAENATFANSVADAGMIWVGPQPAVIVDMGDKERAREIAKAAGVPVLPGSARFGNGDLDGLEAAGEQVGFPLLVKASAGGGGIGMREVKTPDKLVSTAEATQSMAQKAFGDGTIYLERYVPRARHIEVQVFGFGNGSAVHFYERDCSTQRRFQKIVEETPAPNLPPSVRQAMLDAAVSLAARERYAGAGTVEFIVDAESFDFFFLEMNTRIQVEHPVSEMTTGWDLVALQLRLAGGTLEPFEQDAVEQSGHSIECRLYAENPAKNFMPSPGPLSVFDLTGIDEDVRVDSGFRGGDEVTFFYDPMVAKVICKGADRAEALDKMARSLEAIRVEGIVTNVDFLKRTMRHPEFAAGNVFTGYVDAFKKDLTG